jgi:hypothetical protein
MPAYIRIFLVIFAWISLNQAAQAQISLDEAFPGTVIEPELRPLMEEFLSLSFKAQLPLPLPQKITRIQIVSPEQLLRSIKSRGDIQAVAIIEPETQETSILIAASADSRGEELRILLFHELLHAAGYDHPEKECHWAEVGCGIMGRSPFPFVRIGRDHADEIIRKSFKPRYLVSLPRITDRH